MSWELIAGLGFGFVFIGLLVRWLVGKAESGAKSSQRADALDSNVEATRDAERHLDAPLSLSARRNRARERRRLREAAAATGLSDPPGSAGDDRAS